MLPSVSPSRRFLLSVMLLVACSSQLKRYDALSPTPVIDSSVTVAVYSLPLPATDPKTLMALSERGQAAAITGLAAHTNTSGELLAAMASPLEAPTPLGPVLDRTKVRRRLVISVRHDSPWLADRVAQLRVDIAPTDTLLRLIGWDKLTTRYETVELGKSTLTDQASLTAGLGAGRSSVMAAAPETVTHSFAPTASATVGHTRVEEALLRQRYIAVSGELADKSASVVLEGSPGIDLSGNILADLDIRLPRGSYWGVVTAIDGATTEGASTNACLLKPKLRITPLHLPKADDYKATMTLRYAVRRVLAGGATLTESDDRIAIGGPPAEVVDTFDLVSRSDFSATLWYAYIDTSVVRMKNRSDTLQLVFNTLSIGQQVLTMLRTCGPAYYGASLYRDEKLEKSILPEAKDSLRVDQWDPYDVD